MSPAQPSDFPLLLEVFRNGLRYGVVLKEEVVAWADEIITRDDEPDYFFIDLSMQHDINRVITLLSTGLVNPDNGPILSRVIMGVACEKMGKQMISLNQALHMLYTINYNTTLSSLEHVALYQIDEDWEYSLYSGRDPIETNLIKDILGFLAYYNVFTLDNFDKWLEITRNLKGFWKETMRGTLRCIGRDPRGGRRNLKVSGMACAFLSKISVLIMPMIIIN